jgi:hypothetical protein
VLDDTDRASGLTVPAFEQNDNFRRACVLSAQMCSYQPWWGCCKHHRSLLCLNTITPTTYLLFWPAVSAWNRFFNIASVSTKRTSSATNEPSNHSNFAYQKDQSSLARCAPWALRRRRRRHHHHRRRQSSIDVPVTNKIERRHRDRCSEIESTHARTDLARIETVAARHRCVADIVRSLIANGKRVTLFFPKEQAFKKKNKKPGG